MQQQQLLAVDDEKEQSVFLDADEQGDGAGGGGVDALRIGEHAKAQTATEQRSENDGRIKHDDATSSWCCPTKKSVVSTTTCCPGTTTSRTASHA
eukprot:GSA25T00008376001.1